jgi:hypothetical protein
VEHVASDIVAVSAPHVVYANQERVVHHLELLEELGVVAKLLCEEGVLFRTELEFLAKIQLSMYQLQQASVLAPPNKY